MIEKEKSEFEKELERQIIEDLTPIKTEEERLEVLKELEKQIVKDFTHIRDTDRCIKVVCEECNAVKIVKY